MSRSPTSFFRTNRRSGTEAPFVQEHRRTTSYGGTLAPRASEATSVHRSSSTSRNMPPSHASTSPVTMRGMQRLEQRRTMEERNFLKSKARSQNLNPPVDLRMLDYVTPYDDNLMCPICRCPFVDPVVLDCDHCFCRDCIRQTWLAQSTYNPLGPRGDCPTCRAPAKLGPRSATSKILINILDDLVVKCPNTVEGCHAQVKRGEVQDHMNLYCGYSMTECLESGCELPVQRRLSTQGCLHYPVSCFACHEEMQKCYLQTHWKKHCADREVVCDQCNGTLFYRDMSDHKTKSCPANSVPCPGEALGCNIITARGQAETHATACTFAKMAPMFAEMKLRMDEQEAAQKQMNRKLEVLENGFSSMNDILYPKLHDPDHTSADLTSIPLLHGHVQQSPPAITTDLISPIDGTELSFHSFAPTTSQPSSPGAATSRPLPADPSSSSYTQDFDLTSPFPPPATNGGPYASPLHHLLSMHESLRDEMSRISSALQELDGRHSMQTLNENLRTREEIAYIAAQVAGLSRQVHWLTSAQLQRQGGRAATPAGGPAGAGGGAGPSADITAAGSTMGEAVSSAVRGAAAIVNAAGRQNFPMRRNTSEEGRTKL